MEERLLLLLLAPFVVALFMPALAARLGPKVGWAALLAPLTSVAALGSILLMPEEARQTVAWDWVPGLGVSLTFAADGLALFYGLVVSGVGVLVVFYAACYLDDHYKDHGRFYTYLLLFMGAMLGTVFSSNLLVLFVAWETTGVTSFLLIGFLYAKEGSQRGARMAFLTTCFTGLGLLAGIVLLRVVFGTFELAEILAITRETGVPEGKEGVLTAAFFCCVLGIFGKSAQFPFHYWLPNAMAAPTPVSAYLHSATMVKLGVFLTARLLPVFNGVENWMPVLTVFGFGTLVLGAFLALLSQDLKGVLAYTTVAQLGLLIGYYGLHARGVPLTWDYLHIMNHVFYKACLFMVVGIIDHSTGTRDLRKLGGLFRLMPLTGVAAVIGLAALAGLPPTTGFLSKEMLLKTVMAFPESQAGWLGWWPLVAVGVASVMKMAIAVGVFHRGFLGAPSHEVTHHYHAPSVGLQLPPLFLAGCALVMGLAAETFGRFTDLFKVAGVHAEAFYALHLWHGFTRELFTSLGIVAAGAVLYFAVGRARWAKAEVPRWMQFDLGFDRLVLAVPAAGKWLNKGLAMDRPYVFLFVILGTLFAGLGGFMLGHREAMVAMLGQIEMWPREADGWLRWLAVGIISVGALYALAARRPIPQLFAVSVVGLGVAFYFVLSHAPDLALTQILVESAALLLVLLVVFRLKRDGTAQLEVALSGGWLRWVRGSVAVAGGLIMGVSVLIFQGGPDMERAGDFYLETTVPLAKGTNTVNTILVDYRGFDTLLEIAVLVIAALGCLGLLMRRRKDYDGQPWRRPASLARDLFPVPNDFILRMVALGAVIPLNLFALHLFFRGHNDPGGGFIAGLVSGLSLLLVSFALGVSGLRKMVRFNPLSIAAGGVFFAAAVALFPVTQGWSVFHQLHAYAGPMYLGGPFFFDVGVYFAVVGVVMKLIFPLMKSVDGLPAFVAEEEGRFAARSDEPIDVNPGLLQEKDGVVDDLEMGPAGKETLQ